VSKRVTKVVVPAAGMGTRFLPATKALPKEMLPVVDKPTIQYVIEEAVSAGLTDVLMITGRNKNALENHFDRAWELETTLLGKGEVAKLKDVTQSTGLAQIHFLRQGDALGLGHAVAKARAHVGNEAFALLLGDIITEPVGKLLSHMMNVHEKHGGTVIALAEVKPENASAYGIADVEPTDEVGLVRIRTMVEKPAPGDAPSQLAIIGRYVLPPQIFDLLDVTEPGKGNEIQLTDALTELAQDDTIAGPVWGVILEGEWYDTGDKLSYLQAVVTLASEREDLGKDFRAWLRDFVKTD
jgi:UTP--glucose-1-phosphate uridylyltransferase